MDLHRVLTMFKGKHETKDAMKLGKQGNIEALKSLLITHNNEDVYKAVTKALVRIGKSNLESLIYAMGDSDWKIERFRVAIIEALGKLENDRAIEPLIEVLGDREAWVHIQAVMALARIGKSAIKPLINAIGDSNSSIRRFSAYALGELGDEGSVAPLIKALGHSNDRLRRNVVEALGKLLDKKIADNRVVKPLIKTLGDSDSNVSKAAAEALGKISETRWKQWMKEGNSYFYRLGELEDNGTAEPLIQALGHWDSDIRRTAAEALGKLGDIRVIEFLVNILVDSDGRVRKAGAEALDKLGEPKWKIWVKGDNDDFNRLADSKDNRTLELLSNALEDLNWEVRKIAIEALGRIGELALETLIKALEDSDYHVSESAAEALGKLGDARAIVPLIKALGCLNEYVRVAIAEALDKLGEPKWKGWVVKGNSDDFDRLGKSKDNRVVEPLIQALEYWNGNIRRSAARALDELEDKQAVKPLIKTLRDLRWDVREASAEALGKIKDPLAVEPLIKALKDKSGAVREASAYSLGKLGDTCAVKPLTKTLKDKSELLRATSAYALGELRDTRAVKPLIKALRDSDGNVRITIAKALEKLGEPRWKQLIKGDDRTNGPPHLTRTCLPTGYPSGVYCPPYLATHPGVGPDHTCCLASSAPGRPRLGALPLAPVSRRLGALRGAGPGV